MEIKILKKEYLKSKNIYQNFLQDKINENLENFTDKIIKLKNDCDFPIYMGKDNDLKREENFIIAFQNIGNIIEKMNREDYMDGDFWYSYLLTKKRDYLLENYPLIKEDEKEFKNIILKKFDWENYIYKIVLATQYIKEFIDDKNEQDRYCKLISNNLDVYNYIIKYNIFRNDEFLLKILDIIEKNNLSDICKKKIKYYSAKGKDERFGRRVIFELNKSYPIILSPMMDIEDLKKLFIKNLNIYLNLDGLNLDNILS